ncbi:MAG: primosomal replication protein N [Brachymonas sp.]
MNTLNTCWLTACIAEISQQRFTPAGIPALDLQLAHESEQIEAGSSRQVKLSIRAIALGAMAESLQKVAIGKQVKFKGFLAAGKNGKGSVFHITDIDYSD